MWRPSARQAGCFDHRASRPAWVLAVSVMSPSPTPRTLARLCPPCPVQRRRSTTLDQLCGMGAQAWSNAPRVVSIMLEGPAVQPQWITCATLQITRSNSSHNSDPPTSPTIHSNVIRRPHPPQTRVFLHLIPPLPPCSHWSTIPPMSAVIDPVTLIHPAQSRRHHGMITMTDLVAPRTRHGIPARTSH